MVATLARQTLARRIGFGVLAAVVLILAATEQSVPGGASYVRAAVADGELYRLVTFPLASRSWGEALFGLAVAGAIGLMIGRQRGVWSWLGLGLASTLFASLLVYWFEPRILVLSGLTVPLFGVFTAGLMRSWQDGEHTGVKMFASVLVAYFLSRIYMDLSFPLDQNRTPEYSPWPAHLLATGGGLAWSVGELWRRGRQA